MHFSTYRIIDANLNRLREGLRVIEEWCRFVLENQTNALDFKEIRHEIVEITKIANWNKEILLQVRNTEEDVGVNNATASEFKKGNEKEILLANFSRSQEALRVLEEYGKLSDVGQKFEKIRYRLYTLEKNVMQCFACQNLKQSIYILLTKNLCKGDYFKTITNLCQAGAKLFQLREKELADEEFYALANRAVSIIQSFGGTVLINDRFDIALAVGADGVHLGRNDLPATVVRKKVSRPFLIGATVHSQEELNQISLDCVDYIGVGPCFATGTKPNLTVGGVKLVKQIVSQNKTTAFAIGGINCENIAELVAIDIHQVAICSAIISTIDPVKNYLELLEATRNSLKGN